ncbi:MAG: phosphate acyltransferase [Gammaproteobacteria bacterium RBG_16_57_12]|nr:MAG: phosphate acyltransferase [Gammaproteobacteria bacterium RBG_16_57_12]
MGGDYGPEVVIPAAIAALNELDFLHLILVGDQDRIQPVLDAQRSGITERIRIQHASQQVEMHEPPSQALRNKKDSSMRVAINLVREGAAQACVSAGNTGALMATARFVLKMLPGVDRPAIITALPTISGHTHMLDLGANVDSSAENLFEFAVMGSVLTSVVEEIPNPKVALLNIGEEEIKGNEQVKQAARLLEKSSLNYIGFVEGDGIYLGEADVIVCDGFVGNVALKTSEGIAKMITHFLKDAFKRNFYTKAAATLAMPALKSFKEKIDHRRYNGASLVGLQGIVIKSHGGADIFAFQQAIKEAVIEVRKNVPQRISSQLEAILTARQVV